MWGLNMKRILCLQYGVIEVGMDCVFRAADWRKEILNHYLHNLLTQS